MIPVMLRSAGILAQPRQALWTAFALRPSQLVPSLAACHLNLQTSRTVATKPIKVVLLHDVKEFGKKGDVLSVKRGTARLQLIPFGLATYATPYNVQQHARIGEEIPPQVMASLNQYRKGINALNTHNFKFLRYLRPGEAPAEPLDDTIHVEREVKDSSKRRKKEKKVKKVVIEDPECEAITTGVITDFLKEKLKLALPEDAVLLEKPLTEDGEYTIPLKINHLLISGIEERYLDPDILQHTDYELKISLVKGQREKPTKDKKDNSAEEAKEAQGTTAATAPVEEKKDNKKKVKGQDASKKEGK